MGVVKNKNESADKNNQMMVFKVGNDEVKLSPSIVKKYLVNGQGNVSDQEIVHFMHLCKSRQLNPFTREVYLIKYGSEPATMVVSRDALEKRAIKHEKYNGKKVVLYFYSKDNTAGCTKHACGVYDRYPQFIEKGAVILGVSKDSVSSHKRFEEKYGLAFTLLADPERKVIEAYDVWKEKKNYGKVSMGVVRTTYLIDEQGVIIKANDKVKAADDPENMLKELD